MPIPTPDESTRIDICFLVREDAVDYDPECVAAMWRATSEQEWELYEFNTPESGPWPTSQSLFRS
jgi:Rieske 2Fe-2S family protein